MNEQNHSKPLDPADRLANDLREQGVSEGEIQEMFSMLARLNEWQSPLPTGADTADLVDRLIPYMPTASPIRQALRTHPAGLSADFLGLLSLVRTQASIFQPSFWLASSIIISLGSLLIIIGPVFNPIFLIQILGPLLSYLGTATAFRGNGVKMLEFELACPPTPRQLTLVRLFIVLVYDTGLGLILSWVLWSTSGLGFWMLTLHWLAPLLLVAGLALLLSLRLPIHLAAAISYVGWLAVLSTALISQNGLQGSISIFSFLTELGFGLAGLVMIAGAVFFLPKTISGMLAIR